MGNAFEKIEKTGGLLLVGGLAIGAYYLFTKFQKSSMYKDLFGGDESPSTSLSDSQQAMQNKLNEASAEAKSLRGTMNGDIPYATDPNAWSTRSPDPNAITYNPDNTFIDQIKNAYASYGLKNTIVDQQTSQSGNVMTTSTSNLPTYTIEGIQAVANSSSSKALKSGTQIVQVNVKSSNGQTVSMQTSTGFAAKLAEATKQLKKK